MDAITSTPRPHRRTRRLVALAAAFAASAGMVAGAGAGTAQAVVGTVVPVAAPAVTTAAVTGDGTAAGRSLDLLNAARAQDGLAPLHVTPDTTRVATDWAFAMAAGGQLAHNPELFAQLGGWSVVAENVGVGADADQLHDAFTASPGHRANILRENVTEVGIGSVRTADGRLWIVQVFKLPTGVTAPPRQAAPVPAPEQALPAAAPAVGEFSAAPVLERRPRNRA